MLCLGDTRKRQVGPDPILQLLAIGVAQSQKISNLGIAARYFLRGAVLRRAIDGFYIATGVASYEGHIVTFLVLQACGRGLVRLTQDIGTTRKVHKR